MGFGRYGYTGREYVLVGFVSGDIPRDFAGQLLNIFLLCGLT